MLKKFQNLEAFKIRKQYFNRSEPAPGAKLKQLVIMFVIFLHFGIILYWAIPDLPFSVAKTNPLALRLEQVIKPVFRLRASIHHWRHSPWLRVYIHTLALEQNWNLVAPNPSHSAIAFKLYITSKTTYIGTAQSAPSPQTIRQPILNPQEILALRNFHPIFSTTRGSATDEPKLERPIGMADEDLRDGIAIKRIALMHSRDLMAAYADYGRRKFTKAYPGTVITDSKIVQVIQQIPRAGFTAADGDINERVIFESNALSPAGTDSP